VESWKRSISSGNKMFRESLSEKLIFEQILEGGIGSWQNIFGRGHSKDSIPEMRSHQLLMRKRSKWLDWCDLQECKRGDLRDKEGRSTGSCWLLKGRCFLFSARKLFGLF